MRGYSSCHSVSFLQFAHRSQSEIFGVGRVAQLVEHSTLNRLVVGSIPTASTISSLESIGHSIQQNSCFRPHGLVAVLVAVAKSVKLAMLRLNSQRDVVRSKILWILKES